ncbi:substrate-binding periplasmic protein [Corynebacterium callunae]|uniref:transporter substrate-binding domain-containing protein n=1 Tax=Corynebacterium callunae TaxID=1721 RepID=UPI001FFF22C4|nr:ABC transporter substrate-binding protein [Corynebacterium callunae]MCK2201714.1 ABC transporter substrate-binding protein [Corynebacterium callunae]
MRKSPTRSLVTVFSLSALLLGGCGAIPADADGTLDSARDGTLVVGVSEHPPWTILDEETGEITGSEAELIKGFAESINAEIEWRPSPESILAGDIKDGEIDIVIGGLTATSPWASHMALTRAYASVESTDGQTEDMVMGVPMGENELMVTLERHLAQEHGEI